MNGIGANSDEFAEHVAADLDTVECVSTDALVQRVSHDGACGWVRTTGVEPAWTGEDRADRELAAPICAGCPVGRECLELELRTAGYATAGVWGLLPEEDRRAVYLAWSDRRDGGQR